MRRIQAVMMVGVLAVGGLAGPAFGLQATELAEKSWDKLSDREISDWGELALKIDTAKWKHGETEHFVIHYFRDGQKVANRSEGFYADIREFFGNRPDLMRGHKSHVFAFDKPAAWQKFQVAIHMEGIGGVTRRHEFFYLATTDGAHFDDRGKVQAHEMTHLIFNRFFEGVPPLWLNEGIAEYFGQRKTSNAAEFKRQMGSARPFDLDALFAATKYPAGGEDAVRSFYAESAIVVDFLTYLQARQALLPKFVDAMIQSNDLEKALAIYGYKNLNEFKTAYSRYRRNF